MDLKSGRSALPVLGADLRSSITRASIVLARSLQSNDPASQQAWMKIQQMRLLDEGKVDRLVLSLRSLFAQQGPTGRPETIESKNPEVLKRFALRRNTLNAMPRACNTRSPQTAPIHRRGVIEASCKTVIGSRLKKSCTFWTFRGANAIIALRCSHLNGRFEDYWESHRAA